MSEHEHTHESCKELLSSLGDYVDGSLGEDLCLEIEKHMKGCNRCRVVVDTMKKTVELYHQSEEEQPLPTDVRERLFLRLKLDNFTKSPDPK
jgi:anti-sigma factor (TIGR02949 family)